MAQAVLVLAVIALGVGLGVGLKKPPNDSTVACYCGDTGYWSEFVIGFDYLTFASSSAGCLLNCPSACEDCCSADFTSRCCPLPATCYPDCLAYDFAVCPAQSRFI